MVVHIVTMATIEDNNSDDAFVAQDESNQESQNLISRRVATTSDWDYEDVDPSRVPIDPTVKGTLDFDPRDNFECMCCDCPCCFMPRCCYKRRMGAAYILWETVDKSGDEKVVLMLGAGWRSAIFTAALILGVPALAYFFLLPKLSYRFWYVFEF